MTKVYVVESGERVGHRVEGAFSTRRAAEAFATEFQKADPNLRVAEFVLDDRIGDRCGPEWSVIMGCESGATTPPEVKYWLYPHTLDESSDWMRARWYPYDTSRPEFAHFTVGEHFIEAFSGISAEHALELAAESRQNWLRSRAVAETGYRP